MKNKHGGDIYTYPNMIDFSANINPYPIPESIRQAVVDSVEELRNYPDYECRELRGALAVQLRCGVEQIICGNGAADLLFTLAYTLRPRRALLVTPGFLEYEEALRAVDAQISCYPLKEELDYQLDSTYLTYLTTELDMVFLCSPNNPTGQLIERKLLKEILDTCAKRNIFVVLDECFVDFLDEPKVHTLIREVEQYPNVFLLRSFTKMFAIAGLRLGYGICADTELLENMYVHRQPWSVSIPAQQAGIAALKEQDFVKHTREKLYEERDYLCKELAKLVEHCYPSTVNYILFKAEPNLRKKLLVKNIMIRDCSNYVGLCEGYYRIAVRSREDNLKLIRALQAIRQEEQQ